MLNSMGAEVAPRGFEHRITPPSQGALERLVKRVSGIALRTPDMSADPVRGITWRGAANPEELLPQRLALDVAGEDIYGVGVEATRVADPQTGAIAKSGIVAEVGIGFLLGDGTLRGLDYSVGHQSVAKREEYTVEAAGAAGKVAAPPHTIIPLLGRASLDEHVDRQLRFFDQTRAVRSRLRRFQRRVTAQEVDALNALFGSRLEG